MGALIIQKTIINLILKYNKNSKTVFFNLFLFIFIFNCHAQVLVINKISTDSLMKIGDLTGAIKEFQKMYKDNPKDDTNLYNYACALSNNHQNDSSFKYLKLATEIDTSTFSLTDPDFISLRKDKLWNDFENKLIKMVEIKNNKPFKDLSYSKILWKMQAFDQAYYNEIYEVENKIGRNSTVLNALWDLKEIVNNKNQIELERLLQNKGWPKISMVGRNAASTAFLIIQHSNISKQKQYLPIIKKLCSVNEADWQDYALMYDRIQVSENKPQKYGSQIRFNEKRNKQELFPLEDESKVEEWRNAMGMESLADYVSRYGIILEPKK